MMGMCVDGKWVVNPEFTIKKGRFERPSSVFQNKISANGSSDFKAEPNRYHLYISYACPWAHRTLIMRKLKGLENIISYSTVDPFMGNDGWTFSMSGDATIDPLYHLRFLREIYLLADNHYTGRVTVPVLWDKEKQTIVNNESAEIIRLLNTEFNAFTDCTYDYYPENLRNQVDEINQFVYTHINNGVYKTGFAKRQTIYEENLAQLFSALDKIETLLKNQPYLVGKQITEADWRLFTTLIRFDAVYVGHFKCNLRRLIDYPNLSRYLKNLYEHPGIKETVRFDHIKEHYYRSHITINPNQIVAKGPLNLFNN